jgi:hypothetical protein
MKRIILIAIVLLAVLPTLTYNAFSYKLEIPIIKNGATITDTLDNGQIVTYAVSSDDAEQENDEMDKLFDDDLDAGWEGAPEDQNILNIGMRFQNVAIPKGATIDSAYISLFVHESKKNEDLALISIFGEKSAFALTYSMNDLITNRARTTAKIKWTVAEDWEIWENKRTPNLKSIVQEIIDMPTWVTGNPIAIMLLGEDQGPSDYENTREFESFENISDPEESGDGQNHPERVPRLVVYYSFSNNVLVQPIIKNGDSVTDTLDNGQIVTYDISSDDAEQENDEMDKLYDDDLDSGWEGAPEDQNILNIGLRFQNITIPKGAKIDSAYVALYVHEPKTVEDVAHITLAGESSDNALTYDMDNLITDRARTSAQIKWDVAEDWNIWENKRSPDLKNIIQEIVNRNGWQSGNSLAIMLLGEDQGPSDYENTREFESFENISDPEEGGDGQNHPERVPRLFVYYSTHTDVDEIIGSDADFVVYPNPANDNITINSILSQKSEIHIYNQLGIIQKSLTMNSIINIDMSDLPAGVYFIKVNNAGNTFTQKIVKY